MLFLGLPLFYRVLIYSSRKLVLLALIVFQYMYVDILLFIICIYVYIYYIYIYILLSYILLLYILFKDRLVYIA